MTCTHDKQCKYATRNDKTYWLSTSQQIPMMPFGGDSIHEYIGLDICCDDLVKIIITILYNQE